MKRDQLIFVGVLLAGAVVAAIVVLVSGGDDESSSGDPADLSEKPTIEVPDGPPPDTLTSTDIVQGDGPEAKAGDNITVEYVGVAYSTGQEFDSSWERPEPFSFQLGAGRVIPGWDQGLEGMKQGGRRELIIPPDLAYGAQGQPPTIPANATLVFVIDLVSVG